MWHDEPTKLHQIFAMLLYQWKHLNRCHTLTFKTPISSWCLEEFFLIEFKTGLFMWETKDTETHLVLSLHLFKSVFLLEFMWAIKNISVILNNSDLFRRQQILHLIQNNFHVWKKKASEKRSRPAMWQWDDSKAAPPSRATHQQRECSHGAQSWGTHVIGFEDGGKGWQGIPEFCKWACISPLAYK